MGMHGATHVLCVMQHTLILRCVDHALVMNLNSTTGDPRAMTSFGFLSSQLPHFLGTSHDENAKRSFIWTVAVKLTNESTGGAVAYTHALFYVSDLLYAIVLLCFVHL